MTNANEQIDSVVFPRHDYGDGSYEPPYIAKGLTKRELFASMAMQGLCASGFFTDKKIQQQCEKVGSNVSEAIAISAVDLSDALIEALNKGK